MSIKDKYRVLPIDRSDYKEWLLHKHYAHRLPSISYAFGLYSNKLLNGVCTFGLPPSAPLVQNVLGGFYLKNIIELNRLITPDNLEKNVLSYFISQCFKYLPKPICVISFADPNSGHQGYIYQATNWIYTGVGSATPNCYLENGKQIHSKWVKKYKDEGHKITKIEQDPKHRYVMFLGSKTEKKDMKSKLKYKISNYPKGDNTNYDASYEPDLQPILF